MAEPLAMARRQAQRPHRETFRRPPSGNGRVSTAFQGTDFAPALLTRSRTAVTRWPRGGILAACPRGRYPVALAKDKLMWLRLRLQLRYVPFHVTRLP